MSEIFKTINDSASQARDREAVAAAYAASVKAEKLEREERHKRLIRKRETLVMVIRWAFVLIVWVLTVVASENGLVNPVLGIGVSGFMIAWVSLWTGAWMQFMFCEGGVLHGTK